MERLLCPKCRVLQNINLSKNERIINGENNEKIKVVTKSYTCSVCHMFIKSEVKREPFIDIEK